MALFCRRRRSYKHRRKVSCWSNPFVVFLLSFAALGSLRFRTSTKEAASALIQRHRGNKPEANTEEDRMPTIIYTKVEKGKLNSGSSFIRYTATERGNGNPVTVLRWAELLGTSKQAEDLTRAFTTELRGAPYEAFFFETKGVTPENASVKPFEFVLVDAPYLQRFAEARPDPQAFAKYLSCIPDDAPGCKFSNLGGDALLVAPRKLPQVSDLKVYSHLAAFARGAPDSQVNGLLRLACQSYARRIKGSSASQKPLWFSTSGTGIAWLHFRLDSQPKYYQYLQFAKEK